ncbi:MAG: hypothetical protein AB7F43_08780 [Bacteriovoracia bacterium]
MQKNKSKLFFYTICLSFSFQQVFAWTDHMAITKASFVDEAWEQVSFEPIESVLSSLEIAGKTPESIDAFGKLANIHPEKVRWNWNPAGEGIASAFDVLMYSSQEPDEGMDQELWLADYQKYMGGKTGLSSQGIRHMYFPEFTWKMPFATFHYPFEKMGFAPERAQLYFNLAVQAKNTGHKFWAYRFLGMGLHYVQDMTQPYHASQFGSIWLLPVKTLVFSGFDAFVGETKRIVSNFHLAFEEYVNFIMQSSVSVRTPASVLNAFQLPEGDEQLRYDLSNRELTVTEAMEQLSLVSARYAIDIASQEQNLIGDLLIAKELDLGSGFYDKKGRPKIDFQKIELDPALENKRQSFHKSMYQALSNVGLMTRWYLKKFQKS